MLALTLASAEWLRGHVLTGFPWNVLGYALTWPLELMQAASVFGIYGLTLLCGRHLRRARWCSWPGRSPARRLTAAFCGRSHCAVVPLLLLYGLGAWRLSGDLRVMLDDARIRIVQASVPQREKWRPEKQGADLSRISWPCRAATLRGGTTIWPASRI